MEEVVLGGGCFWCTEAIFKRLKGVKEVVSCYANSDKKDPSYEEVSSGETNATEATKIVFDPKFVPLEKLLEIFWHTHNPTTLNRQGNDVGTQYRSVIFYSSESQRKIAEDSKKEVEKEKLYEDPIVTTIEPLKNFYKAEGYHQNFYDTNKSYPYCSFVIDPKITKLLREYSGMVKKEFRE